MSKVIKSVVAAIVVSVLISGAASAVVFGPSNFSFAGYPDHQCYAPNRPYSDDTYAWERFRADGNRYIECVNDYVEAGNNDIRRIRDAQQDARSEAELFISR